MFEFFLLVALGVVAKFIADLRRTTHDSNDRLARIEDGLRIVARRIEYAPVPQQSAAAPEAEPQAGPWQPPQPALPAEPAPLPTEPPAEAMAPDPVIAMQEPAPEPIEPEPAAASEPPYLQDEPAEAGEPPAPPPPRDYGDLEKRFGTQWVVWVGGLALALGGIFLIRYSIEQGYFGPGLRVAIGALLALALVGAGEGLRRVELRSGLPANAAAHIPSILSAAGTTVAYATVYGAYALYDFLSPGAAFLLLGVVALATLAAALVHGPMLAGLGLIGAYVTPMLVSTPTPNYWALYVYLTIVTAAAFALARIRMWRWLAITAAVFGLVWMLPGIADPRLSAVSAHAFFATAGFALSAVFIVAGFVLGPQTHRARVDWVSSGVLAGYLLTAFLLVIATTHDSLALVTFVVLTAATAAIALRAEAATAAMPIAAALAVAMVLHWAFVDVRLIYIEVQRNWTITQVLAPRIGALGLHLAASAAFAAVFGGGAYVAQGRSWNPLFPIAWAAAGILTPILILIALYWRLYEFERALPLSAVALAVAALYALAAERFANREPRPGLATAQAIFASGAIAALALTLTFALEKGWLTVALALMAPGLALVAEKKPWPMLRWAIAVMVGLVLARVMWNPRIIGADLVGTTPILNWLLYAYGVPALAFWTAGHILRKRGDDLPSRMTDSAAILFTVLLFTFEIRHLIYNGDVFRDATGLAEIALQVSSWLATTIGLERARRATGSIIHDWGARILAVLAFAGIVVGLGLRHNPMLTGEPVGGLFFNLILLGYGLPAALTAVLARIVKTTRPQAVYTTAAVTAIVLALVYLSFEVRTLFHGAVLTVGPTTDAEQYAYSAAWLAFGVALLLAGVALGSQPARLASAAVVTLTAGKVFLYDLAGVQGAYRAFSFIGLGLVLIGIGLLYQRLLFPPRPRPADDPASSAPM